MWKGLYQHKWMFEPLHIARIEVEDDDNDNDHYGFSSTKVWLTPWMLTITMQPKMTLET